MVGQRKHPDFGHGVHTLDDTDLFWASPTDITAHLRRVITAPGYQPPLLPSVALELIELTSDPSVPFTRVRALIQSEPLIAAKVLRLVQSGLYSRGAPIASLDDAIARLGLRNLSDLFLESALSARVFRAKGYEEPMAEVRRHSVLTAHVARLVCRKTGFPDEYAYMCGLLHDVGMAAGILVLGDVPRGDQAPSFAAIAPSIDSVHQEASAILARVWKLPADVSLVLSHHHDFEIEGRAHPLAAALCFADWVASRAGAPAGNEVNHELAQRAQASMHLTVEDVRELVAAAEALLEEI